MAKMETAHIWNCIGLLRRRRAGMEIVLKEFEDVLKERGEWLEPLSPVITRDEVDAFSDRWWD